MTEDIKEQIKVMDALRIGVSTFTACALVCDIEDECVRLLGGATKAVIKLSSTFCQDRYALVHIADSANSYKVWMRCDRDHLEWEVTKITKLN